MIIFACWLQTSANSVKEVKETSEKLEMDNPEVGADSSKI